MFISVYLLYFLTYQYFDEIKSHINFHNFKYLLDYMVVWYCFYQENPCARTNNVNLTEFQSFLLSPSPTLQSQSWAYYECWNITSPDLVSEYIACPDSNVSQFLEVYGHWKSYTLIQFVFTAHCDLYYSCTHSLRLSLDECTREDFFVRVLSFYHGCTAVQAVSMVTTVLIGST